MLFPPQEQCDGRTSSACRGLAGLRCRNTFSGQMHISAEGDHEFSSMDMKGRESQMLVRAELVLSLLFPPTPLARQRGAVCPARDWDLFLHHLHLHALNTLQDPLPPQTPQPVKNARPALPDSTKTLSSFSPGPSCHISVFISPSLVAPLSGAGI